MHSVAIVSDEENLFFFFTIAQCENAAEVWILKTTCEVQTPDTPKHWKVLLAAGG